MLPVQSKDIKSLGAGKLLVASRGLGDPSFAETMILLVHCDTQGVVGLVLNRCREFPLSRVLIDLKAAKNRSDPAYLGGPVGTPMALALFQSSAKIEGADHIFYLVSSKLVFEQTLSAQPVWQQMIGKNGAAVRGPQASGLKHYHGPEGRYRLGFTCPI